MQSDTIFDRILRKELPARIVHEDEEVLAFHDANPQAPVARRLGLAESGYRVVINCGRDASQTVDYLHAHILGRRPLRWPPG